MEQARDAPLGGSVGHAGVKAGGGEQVRRAGVGVEVQRRAEAHHAAAHVLARGPICTKRGAGADRPRRRVERGHGRANGIRPRRARRGRKTNRPRGNRRRARPPAPRARAPEPRKWCARGRSSLPRGGAGPGGPHGRVATSGTTAGAARDTSKPALPFAPLGRAFGAPRARWERREAPRRENAPLGSTIVGSGMNAGASAMRRQAAPGRETKAKRDRICAGETRSPKP